MKNKLRHIQSIKILLVLLIFLPLFSCRNYNDEEYISVENEAINDIIPEMTDFENMIKWNNFDTIHLKLLLISTLGTEIYEVCEPRDFIEAYSIGEIPDNEIKEYQKKHEEANEKCKQEAKLFAPLKKGEFKERIFDYKFAYSNLQVELISEIPQKLKLAQNEFGYLSISRIIFNRHFDKGYLSFEFYCGEGCWWANNIEIIKINGKWKISEFFSGGIA